MARTYSDAVRSALARRTVKSAAKSLSDQLTEDLKFDKIVGHPANPPVPATGPAWRSTGEKLVPHGKALEDAKRREAVVKAVTDSLSNIKDAPRRALSGVSTTVDDLKGIAGGAVDDLKGAVEQRLNAVSAKGRPTYDKLVAALKSPRGMAVAGGVALAGGGAALAYKLMSDYIERKRKEKRMRQRKTAAAALPTFPIAPSSTAPSTFVLPRPLPEYKGGRGGRAGLIVALLGALAAAGRGVMAYRRPQSAYDKLVAALKSPLAKRVGIGLGATALGAGVGVGAASLRDKLRTGGANSPDGDARGKKENPEA